MSKTKTITDDWKLRHSCQHSIPSVSGDARWIVMLSIWTMLTMAGTSFRCQREGLLLSTFASLISSRCVCMCVCECVSVFVGGGGGVDHSLDRE